MIDRHSKWKHAMGRALATAFLSAALASAVQAQEAETLAQGRALITDKCGACHAVTVDDESPHAEAPAFRTLSASYPVDHLAESLAEGIMTGHPDMPVFEFEVEEVDWIIAYLDSIQMK